MKEKFYVYDDQYIKWPYDGKNFLVHIRRDECGNDSPRDWDNVGTMACWHRRYRLGDEFGKGEPAEYWQNLVCQFVDNEEIIEAAVANRLNHIAIKKIGSCYDVYVENWHYGSAQSDWDLDYEEVERDQLPIIIEEIADVETCQTLLEPHIVWLPLYLYDHGGITMSTGNFSCPWDSGQVGFIWVSKEKVLKEGLGKTFEDGTCITANEENWREVAEYHLEAEVEIYDTYLRGDVYWYAIKEEVDGHWEDYDSCGGFYGDNLYENGILEACPGLCEAIAVGAHQEGTAHKHTVSYYVYD